MGLMVKPTLKLTKRTKGKVGQAPPKFKGYKS